MQPEKRGQGYIYTQHQPPLAAPFLMPTIDITIDRCLRLQQKLQDILLLQADADIKTLLDDINAACTNADSFPEDNRPHNKRTASHITEADDSPQANKASKPNRNTNVHNT